LAFLGIRSSIFRCIGLCMLSSRESIRASGYLPSGWLKYIMPC
jgi:hypothetical protein